MNKAENNKQQFQSWCSLCIVSDHQLSPAHLQVKMLSSYAKQHDFFKCDHCGRLANLAMVKLPV